MYPTPELSSPGSVDVAPRRRGRPRKPEPPTTAELFAFMQTMMAQQARVMDQLAQSQAVTTDMLKTWLSVYMPTSNPSPSTTAEERALLKDTQQLSEWEPLDLYVDPRTVLSEPM